VSKVSKFAMAGGGTYVVERAELGRVLVQAGVGREDRAATLTLVANYPTHGDDGVVVSRTVVGGARIVRDRNSCDLKRVGVLGLALHGSHASCPTPRPFSHLQVLVYFI